MLELGSEVDLDELPNRTRDALEVRRAAYLLAVLDGRACFTDDQLSDLLPLMEEIVGVESRRSGHGMDSDVLLPAYLRVSPEGELHSGDNRFVQPSTKLASKVQAFYGACTEDQRDVLDF